MSQQRNPVTREGYDRLQEELRELTEVRRPNVIAAVAEARSGDDREADRGHRAHAAQRDHP